MTALAQPPAPRPAGRCDRIAPLLALAWAVLAIAAIDVEFGRHAEATAQILVEGVGSVDALPVAVEIPVNQGRAVDVAGMFPGVWAIAQGFVNLPFHALGPWAGLRFIYWMGALFSALGSWLVYRHALRTLASPGLALLGQGLFLALPAQWALSVHWQQCPNGVLLFGSLAALAAGNFPIFLALSLVQATLHPLAAPVTLAVAWAALRTPGPGARPLLPGPGPSPAAARRMFRITAAVLGAVVLLLLAGLAWRGLANGPDGSLTWYFILRKLEIASGEQLRNLPANLLFLLPLGFLPLLDGVLLPALLPLLAYVVAGTQGLVSAACPLYLGVAFLAYLHKVSAWRPRAQAVALWAGLGTAVALHLFVPWTVLFPVGDGPVGGPLALASWRVPEREAAIDALVREHVPAGTAACVSDYARLPLMMESCARIAPLDYPGRQGHRGVIEFLETTDRGRLDTGEWDFLLVDRARLRDDAALGDLLRRIEASGRYVAAGEVDGAVLYRSVAAPQAPGP